MHKHKKIPRLPCVVFCDWKHGIILPYSDKMATWEAGEHSIPSTLQLHVTTIPSLLCFSSKTPLERQIIKAEFEQSMESVTWSGLFHDHLFTLLWVSKHFTISNHLITHPAKLNILYYINLYCYYPLLYNSAMFACGKLVNWSKDFCNWLLGNKLADQYTINQADSLGLDMDFIFLFDSSLLRFHLSDQI